MATTTLTIGGKEYTFKSDADKLAFIQKLVEENAQLQTQVALGAAAAGVAPGPRKFSVANAVYSLTHKATDPALRGKTKGTVKIYGVGAEYGFEFTPACFRLMLDHKDEILTHIRENETVLAAAQTEVNRIKGK